jgi:p-aminobenzoyl-glutamate transporter AbgT
VNDAPVFPVGIWGVLVILVAFGLLTLPSALRFKRRNSGSTRRLAFHERVTVFIALLCLVAGVPTELAQEALRSASGVIHAMERAVIGLDRLILLPFLSPGSSPFHMACTRPMSTSASRCSVAGGSGPVSR